LDVSQLLGSWKTKIYIFITSMKFTINRIPSCPILNFWDFGQIIALGNNHHAIYWKYGTLAGLRSKPLAQVAMDSELITILALGPFK
jgi:hypothetical protein